MTPCGLVSGYKGLEEQATSMFRTNSESNFSNRLTKFHKTYAITPIVELSGFL